MTQRMPWLRILTEGAVIVLSILLAFAIDAWWDGRQERAREAQFREAVARDMQRTLEEIDFVIGAHLRVDDAAATFIESSAEELAGLPADSASLVYRILHGGRTFSPFDAALRGYDISTLADGELRAALADWTMLLERAQRANPYIIEAARGMFAAGRDDAEYWRLAERDAAEATLLAHMRRAPSFVSAVEWREFITLSSRNNLLNLREATEQLLVMLGEGGA